MAATAALCLTTLAGCATTTPTQNAGPDIRMGRISEDRLTNALVEVQRKQKTGQRVWCVPFARDLSGINLFGNARTWWDQARGKYARSNEPEIGAVMSFLPTRKNPNGHVAVVSQMVSDRQVRLDHSNWQRNRVSRDMLAVDVSPANDWSMVRLESAPGQLGAKYPVQGFILPD
ncbi:CHAP domain-containing protein [Paracoccus limosus]|uniref:CHAP domain-containing protein n=1 Tax=Paracoccus limosus TaxID=913252 RepID=A0A844H9Q3_9RHOB|nr:CHAP domain-containing protein [Paracoccus limosus]MTH35367.1 CHAP domain-containing protein [Paracoccus limosus]